MYVRGYVVQIRMRLQHPIFIYLYIHIYDCVQTYLCNNHAVNGTRPVRRGGAGLRTNLLGGQIISKSCSFSSETVFTHLIVFPTSGFSFIVSVIFVRSVFFLI